MQKKPAVIVVAGPTAVGKTAIAIRLAQHFNTAIISADSRQCYKELNIGVAKPTQEELKVVSHYFIGSHFIYEKVDAAVFENYALTTAEQLFKQHEILIMTGGTGMYIKAFCEGLDAIPDVEDNLRTEIKQAYQENGMAWLQMAVTNEDPDYFSTGEKQNPHRLLRALEVKRSTGNSIRYYQNKQSVDRPFHIIKLGLELPRPVLNEQINYRVDKMMKTGLLQEAEQLLPYQHLNALQTVGYKEIFDYFNKKISLIEAIEQIKIHTRQYAKRQMTWFKKDAEMTWFEGGNWDGIKHFAENQLSTTGP